MDCSNFKFGDDLVKVHPGTLHITDRAIFVSYPHASSQQLGMMKLRDVHGRFREVWDYDHTWMTREEHSFAVTLKGGLP